MRVMARRAERGEQLFHPRDNREQYVGPRPFAQGTYRGGTVGTGLEEPAGPQGLRKTG